MPYRENASPDALAELEPIILDERRQVRARVDELQAAADRLAQALAEHDDPGVLATVGSWLGAGPDAANLERDRAEHARITAAIVELVESERALDDKLATIATARRDRAAMHETRAASLRAEQSPRGDQLRDLDASVAELDARLTALDGVFVVVDRALAAVADLAVLATDVADTGSTGSRVARVAGVLGAVVAGETPPKNEHELNLRRVHSLLPEVRDRLLEVVDAARGRGHDQVNGVAAIAGAPLSDSPESSFLFCEVSTVSTTLDALVTALGAERRDLLDERGRLEAQANALIAG